MFHDARTEEGSERCAFAIALERKDWKMLAAEKTWPNREHCASCLLVLVVAVLVVVLVVVPWWHENVARSILVVVWVVL